MTAPVFLAVDTADLASAQQLAAQVKPHVLGLKLGMEFLYGQGVLRGTSAMRGYNLPLFIDLKLHDIPNTVAGAVRSLLPLQPMFLTLHAAGGPAMLRAAAAAAALGGTARPKLLAVTVLTSLDEADLTRVGQKGPVQEQVVRLATLAKDCGMDGVVCSPMEIAAIRRAVGPDFILMVPGIRPATGTSQDQKRVMSPKEALAAGASYLVIGRPISEAADPAAAAAAIAQDLAAQSLG